jgi:hypothetical protein
VNAFRDSFHSRPTGDIARAAIDGVIPDKLLDCRIKALHGRFAEAIGTIRFLPKRQTYEWSIETRVFICRMTEPQLGAA